MFLLIRRTRRQYAQVIRSWTEKYSAMILKLSEALKPASLSIRVRTGTASFAKKRSESGQRPSALPTSTTTIEDTVVSWFSYRPDSSARST